MIRHIAAGLATLAALTAIAVAIPAAASASTGTLIINGQDYTDPSGCINVQDPGQLDISNNTDQVVYVYDDPDCTAGTSGSVQAAQEGDISGASVKVS